MDNGEAGSGPGSSGDPEKGPEGFFARLVAWMGLGKERSRLLKFTKQLMAFSLAFFVFSSIGPLYNFTEGYSDHDGVSYIDFSDEETRTLLEDIMTEDGFLLKPALNSTVGDRSTANEIFAYEVEPGDTISSIAQRFGIKKDTIIMENNLWNANRLKTGMILNILPVDGISHLVKKGDTISSIAKKYEVEAEDVIRQNQLEEDQELLADT
ncbi:MAG: LysM peptidoglycan-binding domain-containing protein, partial [Candidatus Peregrinibacteria bacterium]|nr:LysM peptidoglycan-binding domain-containing protein [Candidatus Peregrinibacteria bacterium]